MLYPLFYLAFCIYLAYFLRSKSATLLLLLSLALWLIVRITVPGIEIGLLLKQVLTVISYIAEFVVLLYFFPKKVIALTEPNVKKSAIIAAVLVVIVSILIYVSSAMMIYTQQVLMQQTNADVNALLSQVNWFYRFGVLSGLLSFVFYIYLWFVIASILFQKSPLKH